MLISRLHGAPRLLLLLRSLKVRLPRLPKRARSTLSALLQLLLRQ
ncbi:hypothetical protein PHMEG_00039813, partial [Phytophthora megakarya]